MTTTPARVASCAPADRWRWPSTRCRGRPGRGTTSTPRATPSAFTNPTGQAGGEWIFVDGTTGIIGGNLNATGRDHHPHGFTVWLAGGGIKPGTVYGETDELGYHIAKDKVQVHDLQATILHLLGLNHERLTFRFQGRDYRLTDVFGKVVKDILA